MYGGGLWTALARMGAGGPGIQDLIQQHFDPWAMTRSPWGSTPSSLGTSPHNASNLSSGTVPDARFPATLPAASGVNLTALNASNIASGSLADARLSANVPLLNASNTFSGATNTFSTSGGAARLVVANTGASIALIGFATNNSTRGYVGADGGGGQIAGGAAGDMDFIAQSGNLLFSGDGGTTAHLKLSASGLVTTPNASALEVGYKGILPTIDSGDHPIVLADAGKAFYMTGASKTITIPANGTIALPVGTVIVVIGGNATGTTIAITTDALYLAGTGFVTGGAGTSRTLAYGGQATLYKIAATQWFVSGPGVS